MQLLTDVAVDVPFTMADFSGWPEEGKDVATTYNAADTTVLAAATNEEPFLGLDSLDVLLDMAHPASSAPSAARSSVRVSLGGPMKSSRQRPTEAQRQNKRQAKLDALNTRNARLKRALDEARPQVSLLKELTALLLLRERGANVPLPNHASLATPARLPSLPAFC